MASTTDCPACQGLVSRSAAKCPHCGHRMSFGAKSLGALGKFVGTLFFFVIFMVILAQFI